MSSNAVLPFGSEKPRAQTQAPEINHLLKLMAEHRASDLHLVAGTRPHWRQLKVLSPVPDTRPFTHEAIERFIEHLLTKDELDHFQEERELDVTITYPQVAEYRFRLNLRFQSDTPAVSIRAIPPVPESPEKIGLPASILRLVERRRGFILITGPTGSGKSTTIASLVQHLNVTRACHIITAEDPIEFVYPPGYALIEQRQIYRDTLSVETALHAVLRQDPDVVVVGELRTADAIRATIKLAESGHLTLATSHAPTPIEALTRLVGAVPDHAQDHFRTQLAAVLEGAIAQQLIQHAHEKRLVLAAEILIPNPAIRNIIIKKDWQLMKSQTGAPGSQTMREALDMLHKTRQITAEAARANNLSDTQHDSSAS